MKKYKKVKKKEILEIPIGYYLCISNMIVVILTNIYFLYR